MVWNMNTGTLYLFAQALYMYLLWNRHCPLNWLILHAFGFLETIVGNFLHSSDDGLNNKYIIVVSFFTGNTPVLSCLTSLYKPLIHLRTNQFILDVYDVDEALKARGQVPLPLLYLDID